MAIRARLPDMSVPLRKSWTEEQFFSWAEAREDRLEFDGLKPGAMTGGTVNHGRAMRSLHRILDTRLRGGSCEPLRPDAGIKTVTQAVRYPDTLVTRSKADREAQRPKRHRGFRSTQLCHQPHRSHRQAARVCGGPLHPQLRHPRIYQRRPHYEGAR